MPIISLRFSRTESNMDMSFQNNPNTVQRNIGRRLADYLNPPAKKQQPSRYKSPSITSDSIFYEISPEPKHILERDRFVTTSQINFGSRASNTSNDLVQKRMAGGQKVPWSQLFGILPGSGNKFVEKVEIVSNLTDDA